MGSTAHVGIDAIDINDPNGSCMVIRQPSTPHLIYKHASSLSKLLLYSTLVSKCGRYVEPVFKKNNEH